MIIKKIFNKLKGSEGSAMITALFMMLLLVTTVTGLTTLVMSQGMIVDLQKKSSKALQVADAGLNHAMLVIRSTAAPVNSFPLQRNYNGGNYTVTIEQPAPTLFANWYRLTSVGVITGEANRRVQQDIFKMTFWDQGYSGSPVTTLQGNAQLIGSFYVKSDFIITRGGAGVKRGPLYVRGDIQLNNAASFIGESLLNIPLFINGTYSGSGDYFVNPVVNWVPKISLPPVDMNALKLAAIANGTYIDGDVTLDGKDIGVKNKPPNFDYNIQRQKRGVFTLTEITPDPSALKSMVFGSPKAVASDFDDNIYVADTNNNRIQMYNTAGELVLSWGQAELYDGVALNKPSGIRVDGGELTRNLFVSDSMNNRVLRFVMTKVVDEDTGDISYGIDYSGQKWTAGLSNPQKITLDASGRLYVASAGNNKVVRYSSSGTEEITAFAVPPGKSGVFIAPEGIGVDADGNIYVADTGNDRIVKFNSSFVYLDETSGGNAVKGPRSCFVNNGFIYVAEVKASPATKQITRIAASDMADKRSYSAGLNNPEAVIVDSSGILSVADTGNNKVKTYKESENNLHVNGVTYIKGNLSINDGLFYSVGAQFGTIAVEGSITINTRSGRKFFRPNPTNDPDLDDFKLVNAMGLVTENNVTIIGSGLDSYAEPSAVALIYGKNQIKYGGPYTFRGIFATNSLIFEQVPKIYIQKPENMPPGIPGSQPEIYTGGWKELD